MELLGVRGKWVDKSRWAVTYLELQGDRVTSTLCLMCGSRVSTNIQYRLQDVQVQDLICCDVANVQRPAISRCVHRDQLSKSQRYWYRAYGVNDAGEIVGGYFTRNDPSASHGFLDNHGSFTSIDAPNSLSTGLTGINDSGVIVGSFTAADVPERSCLLLLSSAVLACGTRLSKARQD